MSLRGDRLERDHQYFYRVHYDAWVVRNVGGPGKPGEWVKEVRTEDFDTAAGAHEYGKSMTADFHYLTERAKAQRPVGFFVTVVDITEMVVIERGVE